MRAAPDVQIWHNVAVSIHSISLVHNELGRTVVGPGIVIKPKLVPVPAAFHTKEKADRGGIVT